MRAPASPSAEKLALRTTRHMKTGWRRSVAAVSVANGLGFFYSTVSFSTPEPVDVLCRATDIRHVFS
jgi:hypothetical protein